MDNPHSTIKHFCIITVHIQEYIFFYRFPPSNENEWSQLSDDMWLVYDTMPCIDKDTCFEIYVSTRLASGVKSIIQDCSALIQTKKNRQLSVTKVSYDRAIDLVLEATKEYFNGSKALNDPNMELAK